MAKYVEIPKGKRLVFKPGEAQNDKTIEWDFLQWLEQVLNGYNPENMSIRDARVAQQVIDAMDLAREGGSTTLLLEDAQMDHLCDAVKNSEKKWVLLGVRRLLPWYESMQKDAIKKAEKKKPEPELEPKAEGENAPKAEAEASGAKS